MGPSGGHGNQLSKCTRTRLPLGVGDSLWNIIVQEEGPDMSHSLLCASSIHFLSLGKKKMKNLVCVCVAVCMRCGLSEDTSSNAAVCGYF